MSAASIRVALAQMCAGTRVADNLDAIDKATAAAARAGAAYVQTPEMSVLFARNAAGLRAEMTETVAAEAVAALADMARRHAIALHVGSLPVPLADGRFANRSLLFGPDGGLIAAYDKIHLFDADVPGDTAYLESATYAPGQKAVVAEAAGMRLGLSVCYDLRFGALYRALAEGGAEMLCVPSAFTVPTGKAHWEVLVRARAIETGCFVLAAAQGGQHENGRATYGHSLIVDPWGSVIAAAAGDAPGLIMADLAPDAVAEARRRVPSLANGRAFSLSVNPEVSG